VLMPDCGLGDAEARRPYSGGKRKGIVGGRVWPGVWPIGKMDETRRELPQRYGIRRGGQADSAVLGGNRGAFGHTAARCGDGLASGLFMAREPSASGGAYQKKSETSGGKSPLADRIAGAQPAQARGVRRSENMQDAGGKTRLARGGAMLGRLRLRVGVGRVMVGGLGIFPSAVREQGSWMSGSMSFVNGGVGGGGAGPGVATAVLRNRTRKLRRS